VSLADTEDVAGLAGRAGLAEFWPDDNAQCSATMPSNDRDQGRPRGLGLVGRSPVTLYGSDGPDNESREWPAWRVSADLTSSLIADIATPRCRPLQV
jgi:hypothetical protein